MIQKQAREIRIPKSKFNNPKFEIGNQPAGWQVGNYKKPYLYQI